MKLATSSRKAKESGVLENYFVFAAVATAVITLGAFSAFIINAQRYQAALDLSTHTAVRDIVSNGASESPRLLAQTDLDATFQEMQLNTRNTAISVYDSGGRCGTVEISERKNLSLFWHNILTIHLLASEREPADPLSSGLTGVASCIGF